MGEGKRICLIDMKTPFLKALVLGGMFAPSAFAFSLYEIAPPVGVPKSHAIKYDAYANVGYDDNLNSSSTNKQDGTYVQAGVGATYSDQESATRLSYNVSLGARLYDEPAENSDRRLFSESSARASLVHSFGAGSVYTTNLSMSLSTEPNYSLTISSPYDQSEYFNWSWSHAYSRAIDTRWSWTVNVAYSGQLYTRGSYQEDERQYLTGGLTLSYRRSSLTTYNIGTSFRRDFRREGENSENLYFTVGAEHSLTPISSVYASAGLQIKTIVDHTDVYPNLRVGYRRSLGEGLSANMYLSYDNENIDTGYSRNSTYRSDMTLRAGVDLRYAYTHKVSFNAGFSVLNRDYSDNTGNAADHTDTTWVLSVGMGYKFTEHLSGNITYQYTDCERDYNSYERNRISAGVSYSF